MAELLQGGSERPTPHPGPPPRGEGGANVLSEALAASVPILATRIPGSVGILGPEYPGYFPVGDTEALAALLWRAETDRDFRAALRAHIRLLCDLLVLAFQKAFLSTSRADGRSLVFPQSDFGTWKG